MINKKKTGGVSSYKTGQMFGVNKAEQELTKSRLLEAET